MNLQSTISSCCVPAESIQPETIQARSSNWPDAQLLLRSRGPGHVSLPHGQREHMLFCKWGTSIRTAPVRSVVWTGRQVREWKELPERSVTFIPAGQPFEWEWTYQSRSIHLLIPSGAIERIAEQVSGHSGRQAEIRPQFCIHDPLIAVVLEKLLTELNGDGYGAPLAIESAIHLLSIHMLRTYGEPISHSAPCPGGLSSRQKRRVLSVIDERLRENIRLHELADAAGLSQYHFARLFKQTFGMPPHEFLVQRRVARAREMLCTPNGEPIPQIAIFLGFNDESHLRRHFKRIVGMTPAQYRSAQK